MSFAPSFFDQLSDRFQLAVYDTNQELRQRRLAKLLEEVEPMNIRLRELMQAREEAGKSHPPHTGTNTVADTPPTPQPATFAQATATIIAPAKPATQAATCAAKLSALAKDRIAFNKELSADVDAYAKRMTDVKTRKAAVFTKANAILDDEIAGLGSVDDSLTEFEGANSSSPLSG